MRPPEMPIDDYENDEFDRKQNLVRNARKNIPYAVNAMPAEAMIPWRARTQMMSVRGLTDIANILAEEAGGKKMYREPKNTAMPRRKRWRSSLLLASSG